MTELGTKHECAGCGAKFYDLGSAEPVCPKCGLNQLAEEEEPEAAEPKKTAPEKPAKPEKAQAAAGAEGEGDGAKK